ncbi:uncharacterized protein LOC133716315 [Rosa rugosa]|uniref:uncharacterized protein LOC133716315 n=1 Tax=Rosa rugosa TaxID=74645 RepID=UPI002B40E0AE|nr:uncharacterized protein LOC133716315 [Rosa rugosa]
MIKENTSGIFRFKQHLVDTHKGIKPCNKVPPNVKDWCTIALKRNDEEKRARIAVRQEIGELESLEEEDAHDNEVTNVAASESGSAQTPLGGGSTGQPKARGPIDKFVSSKACQVTLNTSYKKEERHDVCREIGVLESLEEEDAHDHEMKNVAASESGSAQTPLGGGSTGQPKARGPIDKFVSSKALEVTLNTSYKKEDRHDVCREIERFDSLEEEDAHDHEVTNVAASESGSAQTPLGGGSTGQLKARGPIDKFVSSKARQVTLNTSYKKEERHDACRAIGRLFYTSALPFDVANNPYYFAALEMVAKNGPGFQPPTSHELRTWMLKKEVEDAQKLMVAHKKDWSHYGCTIMSDGWTDGNSRVILNFLANSPKGT